MKLSTTYFATCGLLLLVLGCNSTPSESGGTDTSEPEVPPAPVIELPSGDGASTGDDSSKAEETATMIKPVEPAKELILKPATGTETEKEMEYTSDSLAEIAKMVADGNATLLDVRSQEEWDDGHVKTAKFLSSTIIGDPAKSTEVAEFVATLDKDKPVYVHCFRGGRAMKCAKALVGTGLDVRPIQAKFEDFGPSGFDIEK